MVYAPHYYDGITLMTKKWNRLWNVDVFGVLRGRYLTPASAIKLGETAIRNCLRDQLSAIRKEGEDYMGNHPCVLTEFGIPFDMDDKHAYKTGDYSSQSSAMDANHFAVEGSLMGGYTLWQYMCQNKHQLGDQWNGEDLSIFSLDDLPLPLSPTAASRSNESTISFLQHTGLNTRESLDKSTVNPGNLKAKLRTPSITSRMMDVPELTNNPGFRAAEAYVRPSPVAIAGTILSYGFDLRNCTFTLKLLVHKTGSDAQTTDISLPGFHFPKDKCEVTVTSGKWTITTDDSDNSSIQRLRWWHLDGEQTIKVTGVPLPHHGPSSGPIVLPPLPHALGIVPSFCVNGQKTLVMKEKVWALAQGNFQIRDESNVELLQCKAKLFSLHHQKFFYDMQGNELWSLKHKLLSIPRQYYGEGPDGREVFHVQGHWHLGGARVTVSFVNTAGNSEPIELALSGNWIDRYGTITRNDRPVAQITRDYFNTRQILGDADTYYVTIAPGMDIALIVSLCVMYDEEMRKQRCNQGRLLKVGVLDPRAA
ncbi:tubby C-terminal-like domain-containing protein [Aspergillus parasiticus]|uniref:Tubby C-terminal-like domain-containing protein n=1 Tax=Aspergillus parasiticus TaxID=5067 RepID=A0A5N6D6F6_ASPPA|nr:tubby C-terminal-like domain-containing protein [Aspergillus parasiticus]